MIYYENIRIQFYSYFSRCFSVKHALDIAKFVVAFKKALIANYYVFNSVQ